MNHGSDTASPFQPFARDSGELVWADDDGNELRVHRDEHDRWHARRWRVSLGRWIGPECGLGAMPLTAKEWKGCAEVIGQVEPASPLQPHADAPGARAGSPQAGADRPEDAALEHDASDQRPRQPRDEPRRAA